MTHEASELPAPLLLALRERYRIERELGAGGMATVYLAHDLKHDRPVAIKVLSEALGAALGAERFLAEIKVTANLQHPNLLPLFDSGEAAGRLFYVMPYIEGATLRTRLTAEHQLSADDVTRLVTLLAGALDFAHHRGVVHRDLKPENILLQAGQPVIADFGIALAVAHAGGARLTQTGFSLGTPHYMSPEQATGEREVDARSDQYALGALTYEMLTGEPPHTGPSAQAILSRVLTEVPRSVRATRPSLSVAVDTAVQRALSPSPVDRFASCGDFARALASGLATPHVTAPAAAAAAAAARPSSSLGWLGTAGIAMLLAVVLAGVGFAAYRLRGTVPSGIDSIVVLPFENRSNDPASDYLSDGISESISNDLSRLPALRVTPTSTASRYKGRGGDAKTVGGELNVAAVLSGSVLRRADSLDVSVELIAASDGRKLWGQRYTRTITDLLAIQQGISAEVTKHLSPQFTAADRERISGGAPRSSEAYELYLNGVFHNKRFSRDGFVRADEYFARALALDSNYALAWAGRARNYYSQTDWFRAPRESMQLAREMARRALALDSTVAEAHTVLAFIASGYDWDAAVSERELTRAIELSRGDPRPFADRGLMLGSFGRFDDAIADTRRAVALDPRSVEFSFYLGNVLVFARRTNEAITQLQQTIALDSTFWFAHAWLGRAYEQAGDMPKAIAELETALALEPANSENIANLGHAYGRVGRKDDAMRLIARLKASADTAYLSPYPVGVIYAGLGDKDQAFAWFERAFADRSAQMSFYLATDNRMDPLRGDPRFVSLQKRIGLPVVQTR